MSRQPLTTKEILGRLVSFDTTSSRSNLGLIDFVREYLNGFGVESQLIFDHDDDKANLLAVVGGDSKTAGIVLSGHTDVVPAAPSEWTDDPFKMVERDGRLYGRGATDMKGFLASSLALVPDILDAKLAVPIQLALSYDEEVGCLGVPSLIEAIGELAAPRPFMCIVGEPTNMTPVLAHKGKVALRCQVYGVEAHSAMTHMGANAIEAASEIIGQIARTAERLRHEQDPNTGFNPPYTTMQTSRIHGGTAGNIVPGQCVFDFDIRNIPADDPEVLLADLRAFAEREVLPRLRSRGPEGRVEWERVFAYPGLNTEETSDAALWIRRITGKETVHKVSYGTEAGLFHNAGIPSVVCGPGSIEQAHRSDEYIAVDQLSACDSFLRDVLRDACKRA